jgi:hypothetical protein
LNEILILKTRGQKKDDLFEKLGYQSITRERESMSDAWMQTCGLTDIVSSNHETNAISTAALVVGLAEMGHAVAVMT